MGGVVEAPPNDDMDWRLFHMLTAAYREPRARSVAHDESCSCIFGKVGRAQARELPTRWSASCRRHALAAAIPATASGDIETALSCKARREHATLQAFCRLQVHYSGKRHERPIVFASRPNHRATCANHRVAAARC